MDGIPRHLDQSSHFGCSWMFLFITVVRCFQAIIDWVWFGHSWKSQIYHNISTHRNFPTWIVLKFCSFASPLVPGVHNPLDCLLTVTLGLVILIHLYIKELKITEGRTSLTALTINPCGFYKFAVYTSPTVEVQFAIKAKYWYGKGSQTGSSRLHMTGDKAARLLLFSILHHLSARTVNTEHTCSNKTRNTRHAGSVLHFELHCTKTLTRYRGLDSWQGWKLVKRDGTLIIAKTYRVSRKYCQFNDYIPGHLERVPYQVLFASSS